MKITAVDCWRESILLTRPYTIAYKTTTSVELFMVRLATADGIVGVGSASPGEDVTGESDADTEAALASDAVRALRGEDSRWLGGLCASLREPLAHAPAARAALDMALHDLLARRLGVPLVDFLGRCHDGLPTSITVGIKSVDETVEEAREYLGRGFDHLKIKLGQSFALDEERLRRVREELGRGFRIRVDANQGYDDAETRRLEHLVDELDVEFVEQPLPVSALDAMRRLPAGLRRRLAADESLLTLRDAVRLAADPAPCGIYNIKLMKCGGVSPALAIAEVARAAGIVLMWGCMDESVVSIAAALHAAYASPATRYLDLDGSFDLPRDPASGGFTVRAGRLWLTGEPGLGCVLAGD